MYDDLELVQQRDYLKRSICYNNGITLIDIPFWWDQTLGSVAHTLEEIRPDIVLTGLVKGDPIPYQMPQTVQHKGTRTSYHPKQSIRIGKGIE